MCRMRIEKNIALFILVVIVLNPLFASDIIVTPSSNMIHQFKTLFIDIDLNLPFENPYNPIDIRVDAIISTPDGKEFRLPCFYKSGLSGKSQWEARLKKHGFKIKKYRYCVNKETLMFWDKLALEARIGNLFNKYTYQNMMEKYGAKIKSIIKKETKEIKLGANICILAVRE